MPRLVVACLPALWLGAAAAQSPTPGGLPPPPGMTLAQSAAMRFPQPVRVGDLVGRAVLQPVERQARLGTVVRVVRRGAELQVVMRRGGLLGFGTAEIAVPVDAMALLGDVMEVVAFTPEQLAAFPRFDPAGTMAVGDDAIIRVGLAKPSH